jgi:hypothetical protein
MNHEKTHQLFTVRRRLCGEVCIVPMPSDYADEKFAEIIGQLRTEEEPLFPVRKVGPNRWYFSKDASDHLVCTAIENEWDL